MEDTTQRLTEKTNIHKMTLYNFDLVITWIYENYRIKIIEVNCIKTNKLNLIRFLSKKAFRFIVNDIEKNQLSHEKHNA